MQTSVWQPSAQRRRQSAAVIGLSQAQNQHLSRMSAMPHSEHSRDRHRAENLMASRSLLSVGHSDAGSPLSLTPKAAHSSAENVGLPTVLVTEAPDLDDLKSSSFPLLDVEAKEPQHLQELQLALKASLMSSGSRLSEPALRPKESELVATTSAIVDANFPALAPVGARFVKRQKRQHRAMICAYLSAVLLFVLAVVYLSAKGVFWTAAAVRQHRQMSEAAQEAPESSSPVP